MTIFAAGAAPYNDALKSSLQESSESMWPSHKSINTIGFVLERLYVLCCNLQGHGVGMLANGAAVGLVKA
ncbi:hypothetical protein GOP47_0021525 [Adiantum capillus-veneris]|uniref:Uncharacterized protein n=1 Tax=Adiantum capillus-veneris TaxID=13818 RepID=A0A9D4Z5C0_ADICA|nr:hypothetical protein GOP47_0021525 [Adiantum capillus-veneris]